MLDLGDLVVFTKVVETESLTKAGRLLGLPKSTVSRRVSRLEEYLGAQLLYRSTRAVTVTQDGALFLNIASDRWAFCATASGPCRASSDNRRAWCGSPFPTCLDRP